MAKLGLLGAIGGLGQGLTLVGKQMQERRERALEEARQLAKEERDRAFRREENEANRTATLERTQLIQKEQNRRTAANISARRTEKKEDREFRSSEAQKQRDNQRELVKLRGQVERDNSAESERLRRKLSAGDVHSVQYGAPDARGYAEVLVVTKDGSVRSTGQKVYRPKREEDEDSLGL